MPRLRENAIVLRVRDWSNSSQIAVLLMQHRGKVPGLAKGSLRTSPSSVQRYSGGFELLSLGEVVATVTSSGTLANVTEWDLQDDHHRLRGDLRRLRLAMYAADLADALLIEDDSHPGMFDALRHFLTTIGSARYPSEWATPDPEAALLRYQWAALSDAGYRPQLDADAVTGEPLPDDPTYPTNPTYTFDPRNGGLTLHPQGLGSGDWRVRRSTVVMLRRLHLDTFDPANPDDAEVVTRTNRLLCAYVRAVLDRELPTMRFVLGSDI